MTKYLDGKPVRDDVYRTHWQRRVDNDPEHFITYFEAKRRDKARREQQRRAAIEQVNAAADQQTWGSILSLYSHAASTPLKRWLYRRAPKSTPTRSSALRPTTHVDN